jgi:hypothetical protein
LPLPASYYDNAIIFPCTEAKIPAVIFCCEFNQRNHAEKTSTHQRDRENIHTPLVKMISNGSKKLAEHLAVAEFQEGKPFHISLNKKRFILDYFF